MAAARRDFTAGRVAVAKQRLLGLTRTSTVRDEAYYRLGLCEESRGRLQSAIESWRQVGKSSPFHDAATLSLARALGNSGRFAEAESLLLSIPRPSSKEADLARQALELLFRLEGRTAEVLPLILETWPGSADPALVLRRVFLLGNSAFPVDYVRTALTATPEDDDRAWLGKANLAAWSGRHDEAARWLDRCSERRPDDQAVRRARLDLAMARNDVAGFLREAEQLPAREFPEVQRLRIRAWAAARRGDPRVEQEVLEALVDRDPGNIGAYDRLAELALHAGHPKEAERFRLLKGERNRDRLRYKNLITGDDRAAHAAELEILAQRLGRDLEARGWSLIRQGRGGLEPLTPDEPPRVSSDDRLTSLQGIVGDLLPVAGSKELAKASGRVEGTVPRFRDEARAMGLSFVHSNGHSGSRNPPPPETMCGGVGLLDYDGDGWLDVFALQSGPFPPKETDGENGDRLYRNLGDGTFEDVTIQSRIASFRGGYGHGVAVADFDSDGHPDLFVTRWRSYALYRNRGDGTFEDVTSRAGLHGDRDWPTSAAFADLDGDGDLDIYVCHYLKYNPDSPKRCEHPDSPGQHECNPLDFPALVDHVFRNDGGRFVDVTQESGFVDPDGRGLGVVTADFDDDGKIDVYVANDMSANYLFQNRGGFHFQETGLLSGASASAEGGYKAGMGIACGDLDGDGLPDLAVTNYFGESTTFYRNLGGGYFADHTDEIGLAAPTRQLLGFGITFMDANNDGLLDVLSANGHVLDGRPRYPWTMPLQILLMQPSGRLMDVSDRAGEPFGPLHLGRGLAVGDLDNDGRQDAVVLAQNEPLIVLHNQTEPRARWIRFRLEGKTSNRDAIGAKVTIQAGGKRRSAWRVGGSSYQAASDPRIHFGVGDATSISSLQVRWPDGNIQNHDGLSLATDRDYLLREGEPPVPDVRARAVEAPRQRRR